MSLVPTLVSDELRAFADRREGGGTEPTRVEREGGEVGVVRETPVLWNSVEACAGFNPGQM